jgi:CBS domain-containing protein
MCFVRDVLRSKPAEVWTVSPQDTAYKALELMAARNVGALPVVHEGRVLGVFSERDYARKVILKEKSSRVTTVGELMSSPAQTITPDTDIEACMALMTDKRIRHLPVLENGRLIGIVSIGDVVKASMDDQKVLIHDLTNFINGNRS